MNQMPDQLDGVVAQIVTDDDLIINRGFLDGVTANMIFDVFDRRARNIIDPETGRNLGSIDRLKVRVRVTKVEQHISLARIYPERRSTGLSETARIVTGTPKESRLTSDIWPEGVERADPVRFTGRLYPEQHAQPKKALAEGV